MEKHLPNTASTGANLDHVLCHFDYDDDIISTALSRDLTRQTDAEQVQSHSVTCIMLSFVAMCLQKSGILCVQVECDVSSASVYQTQHHTTLRKNVSIVEYIH
jgi:hypothetical protein